MPMRRIPHQIRRKPIHRTLQHTKRLPKHQIPHDIKHQPLTPMRRIPVPIPPLPITKLLIASTFVPAAPSTEQLTPNPNIREDILLQIQNRTVTERGAHHPPLARMLHLVNR